jgi:HAD superfamily hydrolase (TIGR01490 family)
MALAFFDLDRTVLSVNSATLWVKRDWREGRLRRRQLAEAGMWLLAYRAGVATMEPGIRRAIATLEGTTEAEIRRRTRQFWDEEIAYTVRPGARLAIRRHLEKRDKPVLLTSSSSYLCELVCRALGIPSWRCTRFEVKNGIFTGRPVPPLCFGDGKLHHAHAAALDLAENLSDAWFYTDSFSDLAVLEAVGHPVCVCPDPRLSRIARQRGWNVEDW